MRKILSIVIICSIVLYGCSPVNSERPTSDSVVEEKEGSTSDDNNILEDSSLPDNTESTDIDIEEKKESDILSRTSMDDNNSQKSDISVKGLDDKALLSYVEDNIYENLVKELDSEDYFVENVEAIYYPREYIEALASNSQSNLYFGYTSDELNKQFKGTKYVFTLGEDERTVVVPMETLSDDVYVKAMENVIVGSGVILICVTVSVVAAPAAPAVGMIFAASASTGTIFALESGSISFAAAAIAKGYETESFDQAMKAGAEAGAEGFKWGAIIGAVVGGASEGASLYGAAKQTNFTMNQYARIQKESGYPLDVIKEFHTMEEYRVFRDAHLEPRMIGNKSALIKTDIDLTKVDAKGRTNLERMRQGLAPQDSQGVSYELHHVGQKKDGTLAILSQAEHDNPAIHGFLERTEAHAAGTNWDAERQAFWKAFAAAFGG